MYGNVSGAPPVRLGGRRAAPHTHVQKEGSQSVATAAVTVRSEERRMDFT